MTPTQRMRRLLNEAVLDYGERMPKDWLTNATEVLALTAEVGEPEDWIKKRADIRNSAIERCAQVVDEMNKELGSAALEAAAARIRAEKDEP